jgi:hypothetical protein
LVWELSELFELEDELDDEEPEAEPDAEPADEAPAELAALAEAEAAPAAALAAPAAAPAAATAIETAAATLAVADLMLAAENMMLNETGAALSSPVAPIDGSATGSPGWISGKVTPTALASASTAAAATA